MKKPIFARFVIKGGELYLVPEKYLNESNPDEDFKVDPDKVYKVRVLYEKPFGYWTDEWTPSLYPSQPE